MHFESKKKVFMRIQIFCCPNELSDLNWAFVDDFTEERPILRPAVVNRVVWFIEIHLSVR